MTNRINVWIKKKFIELRELFGGCCNKCGSFKKLEFAHKKHNGFNGIGRGRKERYYNIKNNPDKYILLCHSCHNDLDNGVFRYDRKNFSNK